MTQMLHTLLCLYFIIPFLAAKHNSCTHYPDPKNGHIICDHLIGKYCTPQCHAGYELSTTPAWAYICNPSTKKWATYPENYPLPWPDCIPKSKSLSRSLKSPSAKSSSFHAITNEDMLANLNAFLKAANDPRFLDFVLERTNKGEKLPKSVRDKISEAKKAIKKIKSTSQSRLQYSSQKYMNAVNRHNTDEDIAIPLNTLPNHLHSLQKYSTIYYKNKINKHKTDSISIESNTERLSLKKNNIKPSKKSIEVRNYDTENDDRAVSIAANENEGYDTNFDSGSGDIGTNDDGSSVDNFKNEVEILENSKKKASKKRSPTYKRIETPASIDEESEPLSGDIGSTARSYISKGKYKNIRPSEAYESSENHNFADLESGKADVRKSLLATISPKELRINGRQQVSPPAKKTSINSKLPLVPVFSVDDLDLLRNIVSKFNMKRSKLQQKSSSLWSKMMKLTSEHSSPALGRSRLLSSKQLAFKDSDLANLIMTDINKVGSYHFRHKINPVIYNEIAKRLKHARGRTVNPYTRQYVFNGATFVPVPENEKPASFLNSLKGGGLSSESTYRWNGATFVPTNPNDFKIEPESNSENSNKIDNEIVDGQYVFNGATFVPLPKNKEPDSFLNNNKGGGLTPESKYHWNGATFVTDELKDSSETLPKDFTSNDVQKILEMWNNEGDEKQKQPDDSNNHKNPTVSDTTQPTFNPYLPTQYPPVTQQNNYNSVVGQVNPDKNDALYYWDGMRYTSVNTVTQLPVGTMRYKKVNGNFEQVDIVTDTTYPGKGNQNLSKEDNKKDTSENDIPKHENSEKNSGVETRTRFVWNGSTFIPVSDVSNDSKDTPASNNQFFQWTGQEFVPVKNNEGENKQLYQWDGNNFVPYKNDPNLYSDKNGPTETHYDTIEPTKSAVTTTKTNNNLESILQSHYPSPSSMRQFQGTGNVIISNEKPIDMPKEDKLNELVKPDDFFQAKISYPNPQAGNLLDTNNTLTATEINNNMKPTERILTTLTNEATKKENYYTYAQAASKPVERNASETNILIPPSNPYLPTPKAESSKETNTPTIGGDISKIGGSYEKQNNVQYKDSINPTKSTTPQNNQVTVNPFTEDEENLESAINNDLGIKNELEDLSKIYANSPGDAPVNIPITHKETVSDLKLLDPSAFKIPATTTKAPPIDSELDDDVLKKSPDTLDALDDIEEADRLLQNEEEKHRYIGPTAAVRSEGDIEATEELKAALRKIEENEKARSTFHSNDNTNTNNVGQSSSNLLDTLSNKEKNKLEKTLQDDMEKLSATNTEKKGESSSESHTYAFNGVAKVASDDNKPNESGYSGLNVADLRALLDITRLAEKQALAKKFGLGRPNLSHLEAAKILRKKSVRHFLKYLLRRHEFSKALKQVKYLSQRRKEQKDLVKKSADSQSVKNLMTHLKELAKKQKGVLPKFGGK